jgi:hypothetical protein
MSAPVTDPPARSRAQRRRDAEHRLAHGVDPGVATAAADGTRDGCLVEGTVGVLAVDAVARGRADRSAARTGFGPRGPDTPHRWYRVTPRRVQAWREVAGMPGRELMREGRWTV